MTENAMPQPRYNSARHSAQPGGLTLLELLVVITILIAISGIVVATLPGLLNRTSTATDVANVSQIDATVKRHMVLRQGRVGDRFDSLIVGETRSGGVADYVGGSESFTVIDLKDADLEAIQALGITELIPAAESTENATFQSHLGEPVKLTGKSRVCAIHPDVAEQLVFDIWNIKPEDQKLYLVFGIGSRCSLVGGASDATFGEAPVHFSDDALSNPKTMYSRYLIVIELDRQTNEQSHARYIGTAVPGIHGMESLGQKLQQHYSNN